MWQFLTKMRILIIVLAIGQTAFAQVPDTLWSKTFGGSNNESGRDVQQTSDGGFIITGQFGFAGQLTSGDLWLIRTNGAGDTLWTKVYGGDGIDQGNAVQQISDGGYIVAGYTTSADGRNRDLWLLRTNADGDTVWTRTLGGPSTDQANGVQQTPDGGFIIAGTTQSFGAGGTDVWLVRTDADGDTLWTKTYGGPSSDGGNSIQQTSDGGFIVAGNFFSLATGAPDVWQLRTNAAGDTLWTKTYNGPYYPYSFDSGNAVQQTPDGGFIIVGETNGLPDTRNTEMWLIRTDANGDTVWTKTYGGASTDRGYSVHQTSDGGFVVAGFTYDGTSNIDARLIRTDAAGDTLWTKTFGDAGNDQFYAVRRTADGGFVVTGFTSSYGAGGNDVSLIRLASETTTAVAALHTGPDQYRLSQNYPNPFNPVTTIRFELPQAELVTLRIFDTRGREVATLVNEKMPVGEHRVNFDGRRLASGIYFYQLRAGEFVQRRKLALVK